jgi:hypothetical protein
MATDTAGKKAALEARLKVLDADSKRIVDKQKATQEQLANLGRKAAAPAKATKAARK